MLGDATTANANTLPACTTPLGFTDGLSKAMEGVTAGGFYAFIALLALPMNLVTGTTSGGGVGLENGNSCARGAAPFSYKLGTAAPGLALYAVVLYLLFGRKGK